MKISWQRNLVLVWLSQFFAMAAFSSAYTYIPFYFRHIGVPDDRLSWYVALFAAGGNFSFAIASPIWGMVSDAYGRRLMLLRANFAAALLVPLMGLISDPMLLVVHRLALGAMAGTVTAAQTLVLSTTPQERRSFALGAIASALFSGMMVGQFVGGDVVNWVGFSWTFTFGGILLGLAGFLAYFVKENFHRSPQALEEIRAGFHFRLPRFGKVWYLMLVFVCMSLARDFDGPFTPLLVDEIVKNNEQALRWSGYLSGYCSAAAIFSGLALGYIADRLKLLGVLMAAILVAGLLRIPQALADSIGMLLLWRVLMVMAAAGIEPLLQSWLAGSTREAEHGRYFGWAASFKAIGWTLGPLLGGGLIRLFDNNIRAVFGGAALLFLLLIPLIAWVTHKVPPPARRPHKA